MQEYNPPRQKDLELEEPLEVELVYNVRSCGTCTFFWPKDPSTQPYGPFPTYDFKENFPETNQPANENVQNYPWVSGRTSEPAFPNGEVMDGCRKAPIMTIGINPNLTAFAPGQMGTSWIYPSFTDKDSTDAFAKYAYYYRYRSVYQEHLKLEVMERYLMKEGQIIAQADGTVIAAERTSESPNYSITVQYEGEAEPVDIPLKRELGTPRYVLLYDHFPPNNAFKKGDVIAARLNVPANIDQEIDHGAIGYYEQFVPVLNYFESFLKDKGCDNPQLRIGEDVGQLDMVACASPHWNEKFMGNQLETVVGNCVSKNAWAVKQLVQSKPVVLFLVGESSYNMFNGSFGKLIKRNTPLSKYPVDGAFTLFRETIEEPTYVEFSTNIQNRNYQLKVRLVAAPHFSYNTNYVPQYRLSIDDWEKLKNDYTASYDYFHEQEKKKQVKIVYAKDGQGYIAVQLNGDAEQINKGLQSADANGYNYLQAFYYNPHLQMADLLGSLYDDGLLTYTNSPDGKGGELNRTEGSCQFCVNDKWQFPLGCPYKKNEEKAPPAGYLEAVAKQMVAEGS